MKNARPDGPASPAHRSRSTDTESRSHADELSEQWREQHATRVAELSDELMKQHSTAERDEQLLLDLVAHDVALAQELGEVELQLAKRMLALIDDVAVGLKIAKTLKQVSACREGTTRRLQEVLQTVRVLEGQRRLARTHAFRRVA
jgi:hypothetical protein